MFYKKRILKIDYVHLQISPQFLEFFFFNQAIKQKIFIFQLPEAHKTLEEQKWKSFHVGDEYCEGSIHIRSIVLSLLRHGKVSHYIDLHFTPPALRIIELIRGTQTIDGLVPIWVCCICFPRYQQKFSSTFLSKALSSSLMSWRQGWYEELLGCQADWFLILPFLVALKLEVAFSCYWRKQSTRGISIFMLCCINHT